ncbi:hypothetical protein FGG08_007266 [Glutinoglossum americanum]|uniref:Uncharacterized protein n=1 Tax=Glutinoglossum americanum TaxID=1670608 RepID=A0A9P8HZ86_9PEZI|nr:hypothetical protein FGG08_007266 [Glutinoglossum americanum]
MSLGISIFDFFAIPNYAWQIYKACRSSSDEFNSIAAEVAALHIVLKETEEYVSGQAASLGPDREAQLIILGKGCREVLQDLERLLLRYESLGTQSQRTWDRMKWGSSQARIEAKLDKLVNEIRAGKRSSTVVSSHTIESLSKYDQAAWRQLRKELEDMGISVAVLNEHRQFITDWLKKAIEDGVLQEQCPEELGNEALNGSPSMMIEQKVLPWTLKELTFSTPVPEAGTPRPMKEQKTRPWTPLSRALTSPTPVPDNEMPQPVKVKSIEKIMVQLHRSPSARSNRTSDRPALHTRVNSFISNLSRLSLLDIQPRRDKESARNGEIEKQLERERLMQRKEIKLLLLDDNEPGNSTLLKQIRLQYSGGYTPDEQESYKSLILSNILQSMKIMLKEAEQEGVSLDGTSLEPYSRAVQLLQPLGNPNEKTPPAAKTAIRVLWGNPRLQQILRRASEYKRNRAARYYLSSIDRITAPTYRPTDKDILHARAKTTGVTEQRFDMPTLTYRIFDTIYPEKRQLVQYFEKVTAIIFSIDLADSDRVADQNKETCLLQEDIAQFDAVCNSRCFVKTPVILYFNNTDCFYDKLNLPPLSAQFPDYKGGSDNLAALDYIRDYFQRLNRNPNRDLYIHLSPSMDTSQFRVIERAINNIMLQTNVDGILQTYI